MQSEHNAYWYIIILTSISIGKKTLFPSRYISSQTINARLHMERNTKPVYCFYCLKVEKERLAKILNLPGAFLGKAIVPCWENLIENIIRLLQMQNQQLVATFLLGKTCLVLIDKNYYSVVKNTAGYHPGQVKPSTADGAPSIIPWWKRWKTDSKDYKEMVIQVIIC